MKLIIAIVSREDEGIVAAELTQAGFYSTRLATKGGFLTSGNTTFLVGTDADKVDTVIEIIRKHSKERKQIYPFHIGTGETSTYNISSMPFNEVTLGGATVFVVDVDRFEKI